MCPGMPSWPRSHGLCGPYAACWAGAHDRQTNAGDLCVSGDQSVWAECVRRPVSVDKMCQETSDCGRNVSGDQSVWTKCVRRPVSVDERARDQRARQTLYTVLRAKRCGRHTERRVSYLLDLNVLFSAQDTLHQNSVEGTGMGDKKQCTGVSYFIMSTQREGNTTAEHT